MMPKRSKRLLKCMEFFDKYIEGSTDHAKSSKPSFDINFNQTALENLKRAKKKFHLNDKEFDEVRKRYENQLALYILEKCKFSPKLVDKHFRSIIPKTHAEFFKTTIVDILDYLEPIIKGEYLQQEFKGVQLVRMGLCLSFEYACKLVLLRNNYSINEPKKIHNTKCTIRKVLKNLFGKDRKRSKVNKSVLPFANEDRLIKNRTVSLRVALEFIREKNLLTFTDEEEMYVGYLYYLRNLVSHTPYFLGERGTYAENCVKLIKKMIN